MGVCTGKCGGVDVPRAALAHALGLTIRSPRGFTMHTWPGRLNSTRNFADLATAGVWGEAGSR